MSDLEQQNRISEIARWHRQHPLDAARAHAAAIDERELLLAAAKRGLGYLDALSGCGHIKSDRAFVIANIEKATK
jgi:hypothetical protein